MSIVPANQSPQPRSGRSEQVSLVDLVDRLLSEGVVLAGRVTLSIADVDLVDISLQSLLTSVNPRLTPADQAERDPVGDSE